MNRHLRLIACGLFFNVILNSNEKPIIINVNSNMTGPCAQASSENKIDLYQKNSLPALDNLYDSCKKQLPEIYNKLLKNKYQVAIGSLCASYAVMQYKLHYVHKIITDFASWNNWKPEISTQQLTCIPHNNLIPELINSIQKKHFLKSKTSMDQPAASAFNQFIKEVQQELEALEWYITAQKLTKAVHLSKLFFFKHKKSFVHEKINRIHILLDIFISWHTKELLKES